MQKKSYLVLNQQVEKLFNMPLSNKETLDIRLQLIESLIVSCGWDIDEYYYYIGEK